MQELPPSLGRLQRLKLLQLDANQIGALPPPVLRDCAALATISLHSNPISPEALQGTEGYAAFEARRQSKVRLGAGSRGCGAGSWGGGPSWLSGVRHSRVPAWQSRGTCWSSLSS